MKAHEALHGLAEKYSPMSEQSSLDLQNKSAQAYHKALTEVEKHDEIIASNAQLEKAFDLAKTEAEKETIMSQMQTVPKIGWEHKLVRLADKWWARYLISALFVWIQPKIQNYLNPAPPVAPDDFDEDDDRR